MKYRKISKIATTFIAMIASQSATAFYSVSLEGPTLTYFHSEAALFQRPVSDFTQFWDFCQPYNCSAWYNVPNVSQYMSIGDSMQLSDPGSVWAHEANLSNLPYVNIEVLSFPVNATRPTGKVVFNVSANDESLSGVFPDAAVGFTFVEYISDYFYPDQMGNYQLSISTAFDESMVPFGYMADVSTTVEVGIYASWFTDQGKPAFLNESVLSERLDGSGVLDISLPLGFLAYPEIGDAPYASYSIQVRHEITLAQAVPEPETYAFFLTGLALVSFLTRRRSASRFRGH